MYVAPRRKNETHIESLERPAKVEGIAREAPLPPVRFATCYVVTTTLNSSTEW